jgi:hypothetical protein
MGAGAFMNPTELALKIEGVVPDYDKIAEVLVHHRELVRMAYDAHRPLTTDPALNYTTIL